MIGAKIILFNANWTTDDKNVTTYFTSKDLYESAQKFSDAVDTLLFRLKMPRFYFRKTQKKMVAAGAVLESISTISYLI